MSITTLYAELVVVGNGALLFILLFFHAFVGDWSWFAKLKGLESSTSLVILIPALSLVYLLGIIITNLSHLVFLSWEEDLRTKMVEDLGLQDKEEFERIRNELYTSPDTKDLIEDFEFRRSKVRICRGWYLNSIFVALALIACLRAENISRRVAWFGILACGLLVLGTLVSWRVATKTELDWFKSYAKKLLQQQKAGIYSRLGCY